MSRELTEFHLGRHSRGITLLETLIASALFSLVMTGVYLLYTTMQGTMSRGEMQSDLQQNARVGLDRMVQEIRMVGYDPSGAIPNVALQPKSGVRAASSGCFAFVAYNPSSGASAQITYDLSGTTLRRREDPWGGSSAFTASSAQSMAESVNLLTFTYFDYYNQAIVPAAWTSTLTCPPTANAPSQSVVQLTFWQMRQIRRVAITVQTQGSRPGVFSEFFTLTSDVRLRNR